MQIYKYEETVLTCNYTYKENDLFIILLGNIFTQFVKRLFFMVIWPTFVLMSFYIKITQNYTILLFN